MFFQMIDYSTTVFWVQTYNWIFAKPVESKEKALEVGEFVAHQLYDGTSLVDFCGKSCSSKAGKLED